MDEFDDVLLASVPSLDFVEPAPVGLVGVGGLTVAPGSSYADIAATKRAPSGSRVGTENLRHGRHAGSAARSENEGFSETFDFRSVPNRLPDLSRPRALQL